MNNMRQGGGGGRRGGRSGGGTRQFGGGGRSGGMPSGNSGMGGGGSLGNGQRSAAALRHQSFDSNGPDVRVRGNAWQVFEKYQALARDAASAGDRVLAENYFQHAEHYGRIIQAINEATLAEQRARGVVSQPENFAAPTGAPEGQVEVRGSAPAFMQPAAQPGAPQPGLPPAAEGAQVQPLNRPAASPFFTPDERPEETDGPQSLVANR